MALGDDSVTAYTLADADLVASSSTRAKRVCGSKPSRGVESAGTAYQSRAQEIVRTASPKQDNHLFVPIQSMAVACPRPWHPNHRTAPAFAPAMAVLQPGQERALVRRV